MAKIAWNSLENFVLILVHMYEYKNSRTIQLKLKYKETFLKI